MSEIVATRTHESWSSQSRTDTHECAIESSHGPRQPSGDATDNTFISEAQETHKQSKEDSRLENIEQLFKGPEDGLVDVPICLLGSDTRVRRVVAYFNSRRSPSEGRSSKSQLSLKELSEWYRVGPAKLDIEVIEDVKAPVTKESIKELELKAIQNNLALRIDLCFDFELLFQKIGGVKGQEKFQRAVLSYQLLLLELQAYAHKRNPCSECRRDPACTQYLLLPSRLESYLDSLTKLVEMLVPESDKEYVVQKLDAQYLARQIRIGQLEAEEFSAWLSKLLMSHCAPMRDEMCIQMDDQISNGIRNLDLPELVAGLETLLNLLENMKIDIANHQVRTFKLLLITDTVPFLRDCFSKMVKNEQLDLTSSRAWFQGLTSRTHLAHTNKACRFLDGVLAMCSPSKHIPSLATFNYDRERLQSIQNEIRDLVQLRTCMMFHVKLASLHKRKVPNHDQLQSVSGRIWQIMMSSDDTDGDENRHLEDISLEIARAVSATPPARSGRHQTHAHVKALDLDETYVLLTKFVEERKKPATAGVMKQVADLSHPLFLRFQAMDTLPISIEQRNWSNTRSSKGIPLPPDVEDLSRRLAHIAVIHYRVWGDSAYDNTNSEP